MRFSYKGGYDVRGRTPIEVIKRKAGLGYRSMAQVISNIMLFKTVIPLRN